MLPVQIFTNLRFSAASVSITSAFFALFGFIFLVTQYFQLIRGYTPLQAGVRTLPVAISIAAASVLGPRIVDRVGTTRVVTSGLALMAAAFAWISTVSATTSYYEIAGQMIVLGVGLGLTTAPATESIMGSLTVEKAGVGSAVNDTTRELGGTLGVAVVGSVFSSVYIGALSDGDTFADCHPRRRSPPKSRSGPRKSLPTSSVLRPRAYLTEVSDAFLSGSEQLRCSSPASRRRARSSPPATFQPAPPTRPPPLELDHAIHCSASVKAGWDRYHAGRTLSRRGSRVPGSIRGAW